MTTIIYFMVTPIYRQQKGKPPTKLEDYGFGFRFEKLPPELVENNLVDAIYFKFPKHSTWQERSVMIAALIQLENLNYIASTQNNK